MPKKNKNEKVKEENKVKIGIIGGSGLDKLDIFKDKTEIKVSTPYGDPSDVLICGMIGDVEVIILPRHGKEHQIPPTQVNYRANIQALKDQGCTHVLATTACGSLKEEIGRGHLVILDQFIDFTRHRQVTFHEKFEKGPVHTPMAEPFDKELRDNLINSCRELHLTYHPKGTVVTIEGPRFSTKAESHMFIKWGADVINMSIAPEAVLANEAGLKYAAIAMSTDYDCWKEDEKPVTWDMIVSVMEKNTKNVTKLLLNVIPKIK
jgi:5'-methylthioadenosine phosphorylase